jgi:peroxiredoxin
MTAAGAWPWPAPVADAAADHLVAGTRLPDIALATTSGDKRNLARMPGRAVLVVYPWTGRAGLANPPDWDTIPGAHGSTPELEGFRDHAAEYRRLGFELLALSGQDGTHQRELAGRLRLPFPILSDDGLAFAAALRLPTFTTGGVTYLKRLTLLIADGRIERAVYPVHPPDTHARDLIAMLA